LEGSDADLKIKAATGLSTLVSSRRLAEEVVKEMGPLLHCLRPKEQASVRLAALGTLRILAEQGQAVAVGSHSYAFAMCLKDEDPAIQRKAAALYRVIAEEGGAAIVSRDINIIMQCFENSQQKGASLLAPLDALTAIASAGEAAAVAQIVARLVAAMRDKRPHIRVTCCRTLAAIARGGGRDLLGQLGLTESSAAEATAFLEGSATLFELLVIVAMDDEDASVRLASADALRCLPEADPDQAADLRGKHHLPLVDRMRRLVGQHDGEVKSILCTVLGLEEGEECVICQRGLHWSGGPESLPCGHAFHAKCIEQWFEWKAKCGHTRSCPLCRWTQDSGPKTTEDQS